MKKAIYCVALTAAAAAVFTWVAGWLAVPAVALVAGWLRCKPWQVAVGSAAGWTLLLGIDAAAGSISRLGETLAGVMGMPAIALVALTLAFPALLGWSAASVSYSIRAIREKSA